jgi:hypothetical protein
VDAVDHGVGSGYHEFVADPPNSSIIPYTNDQVIALRLGEDACEALDEAEFAQIRYGGHAAIVRGG